MTKPLVRVSNLHKAFDNKTVVDDVSFEILPGTVTVIIGPSGSGKTTILRALNALELAESGTVEIGDFLIDYASKPSASKLRELRGLSGMVFQGNNLFSNLTALQNVTEGPLKAQKRPKDDVNAEARALLAQVGLSDKENSRPHELSGGQQQRVGIARALALKPKVLLFDEPTSALDPELVSEVLSTMRALADQGWTMVVVTHEMRFAAQVADEIIFIDRGKIVESGTPAKLLKFPTKQRTQDFLRSLTEI